VSGLVLAVSRSAQHVPRLAKPNQPGIRLIAGLGVENDAHLGVTVQHLFPMRRYPTKPNLRQVHLMHAEFHDELNGQGFSIRPGTMGENITTREIDLLGLPLSTRLHLGPHAVVEVAGLRNPCEKLNRIAPGLMAATLGRDSEGRVVRKAGIMTIVITSGDVTPGDRIEVELPKGPFCPLGPV